MCLTGPFDHECFIRRVYVNPKNRCLREDKNTNQKIFFCLVGGSLPTRGHPGPTGMGKCSVSLPSPEHLRDSLAVESPSLNSTAREVREELLPASPSQSPLPPSTSEVQPPPPNFSPIAPHLESLPAASHQQQPPLPVPSPSPATPVQTPPPLEPSPPPPLPLHLLPSPLPVHRLSPSSGPSPTRPTSSSA